MNLGGQFWERDLYDFGKSEMVEKRRDRRDEFCDSEEMNLGSSERWICMSLSDR